MNDIGPKPRQDGRNESELELDFQLASRFGAYASYVTPNDPLRSEFHGDGPAREMERLLGRFVNANINVLDLGCGAGFTLCRLARQANSIWGVDLQTDLLGAARERIEKHGIENATIVSGDTCHEATVDQIPDDRFEVAFSRRGPFLTEALTHKLTKDAVFVVELAQDFLGLKEIFGRKPFLPGSTGDPDWAITSHLNIGFVPISAKTYWYEEFFSDPDHLGRYLSAGAALSNWWMDACPFDPIRDRAALELYARYNTTSAGLRLIGCRKVYVFRRETTRFYPAVQGLY